MSAAKIEKFTSGQINIVNLHLNFLRNTHFPRGDSEYSNDLTSIVKTYENLLAKMQAGNIEKESIAALINDINQQVTTLSKKYNEAPSSIKSEMAFLDHLKHIPAKLTALQNSIAQLKTVSKEPSLPRQSFNLFAALGLVKSDLKKVIEKRKEEEIAPSQTAPTAATQPAIQKQEEANNLLGPDAAEPEPAAPEAEADDDEIGMPEREGGPRLGNGPGN